MTSISRHSILPRLYIITSRIVGWLPNTLVVLHRAIWLGLLDADALTELTRLSYLGRSGFEGEAFNLDAGLWSWEAAAIGDSFIPGVRLMVAGAGGGREVIALARRGFKVTGCDFSPDLTAACRRNLTRAGLDADVLDATQCVSRRHWVSRWSHRGPRVLSPHSDH